MVRQRSGLRIAVVGVVVAALLGLPGQASADGSNPPVVSNGSVTPTNLPFDGGNVMVTADVTSPNGTPLQDVSVIVSSGFYVASEMALIPDSGGSTWWGTVELGANPSHDPKTWRLTVHARDINTEDGFGVAGDVVVAGQPPDDATPTLSDATATPRAVPADGGDVALAVTASDVRGIYSVHADITRHGVTSRVVLAAVAGSEDRFASTVHLPKNPTASAQPYAVSVTAVNVRGYTSTLDAGAVTVAARRTGTLAADHRALHFSRTHVSKVRALRVLIRNTGASSTVPVRFGVTISGTSFRTTHARTLTLNGGRTATITIEFRPRSPGAKHGTLVLRRPDKRQKPITVRLYGRGVR